MSVQQGDRRGLVLQGQPRLRQLLEVLLHLATGLPQRVLGPELEVLAEELGLGLEVGLLPDLTVEHQAPLELLTVVLRQVLLVGVLRLICGEPLL